MQQPSNPGVAEPSTPLPFVPYPFRDLHVPLSDHALMDGLTVILPQSAGIVQGIRLPCRTRDAHLDLALLADGLEVAVEYLRQGQALLDAWWAGKQGHSQATTREEGSA